MEGNCPAYGHSDKWQGRSSKHRSTGLQSQCLLHDPTPHWGLGCVEAKTKTHFNLLNRIPLHFKRLCVNDCPENLPTRKGNRHSAAKPVAQMSSSAQEPEEQNRVPGKVMCVSVSDSEFFREVRSRGEGKEKLILDSAEHVK